MEIVCVGGGPAGLTLAALAKLRDPRRDVTVLERNPEVGRKILISGGGRCNFTNLNTRPENFISRNSVGSTTRPIGIINEPKSTSERTAN